MPFEWEGEGGAIRHTPPCGKVTVWQRETCPDCNGGGMVRVGDGQYGDSLSAQHVPVYGKCRTCEGSGLIARCDLYEVGEYEQEIK